MNLQTRLREFDYYLDTDNDIGKAADHIDTLEARIKELEQDAARYQWLRYGDNDEEVIVKKLSDKAFLLRMEKLDAAIDAAMKDQS